MAEGISEVKSLPNLACHISRSGPPPDYNDVLINGAEQVFNDTNATILGELVDAGFPATIRREEGKRERGVYEIQHSLESLRLSNGCFPEVPTGLIGIYNGWVFERCWYYYACKGSGIPPDIAEEFHKTWGRQVRVEGHCGCPSPLEWCQGFSVGSYHIDTPGGLKAFVELLDKVYKPL